MNKKIFIAVVFFLLIVSSVSASAEAIGYCKGDYVRVREKPNTNAEILGRVHMGAKLKLIKRIGSNSQYWYEIENPFGNGTAFISGQYVKSAADNNNYDAPNFLSVNDGNLRLVNVNHEDNISSYNYECDVDKYNKYVERYLQKLNSYPLRQINDFDIELPGRIYMAWDYVYTGSKNVKSVQMIAKGEDGKKKYSNVHLRLEAATSAEEDCINFRVQVVKGLKYEDRSTTKANPTTPRKNTTSSNTRPTKQTNAYDVPNFLSVDDGDLRYTHTDRYDADTYYYHECDIGKDNKYAERYVQKLASYPFKLVNHFVNDFRGTSYAMLSEVWDYVYTGSRNVKSVKAYNVQHIRDKYDIHLRVEKVLYGAEGRISFSIRVAKGLAYDERGINNKSSAPERNNRPSDSSSSETYQYQRQQQEFRLFCTKCHGNKTITCNVCNGKRGTMRYVGSTPNYSGRKDGARTIEVWEKCSKCNGRGELTCPQCDGKGYTVQIR